MPNSLIRTDGQRSLARALIDTSHLPLLLFDGDLHVVSASRSFCETFAIHPDQTTGLALAALGNGEWNIPQLRLLLENALLDGPEMGNYEIDLTRTGVEPRRVVVNVQSVAHGDGPNSRILLTINDVTNARALERLNITLLLEKDKLLQERAVLLQEMQHRVANSLQIIASVLLLKARKVTSEESRLHLQDAHDRVMSVAAVQQLLQSSLGEVEVGPYLTKLCESLASSMIRESRPLTLRVRSDNATISSHDAVSLGLVVTELVINALKHAFPDGRGGKVLIAYEVEPAGWTLSVTDDGVGRAAAISTKKPGLGTSIVEAIARQLGARVVLSDAEPGTKVALVNAASPVIQ